VLSLAKKKTVSEPTDQTKQSSADSLRKLLPWLPLLVLLCLSAGVIALSYQQMVVVADQTKLAGVSLREANLTKGKLQAHIDQLQQQLDLFAQNQAVRAHLNDPERDINQWLIGLRNNLPEGSQIQLLTAGIPPQRQAPDYNWRFAELDMINRALRDEPTYPEAVRLEQGVQLIFVSLLTDADETPLGIITARIPATDLARALPQASQLPGAISVVQQFKSEKPTLITQRGQGVGKIESSGLNNHWRVEFSANQQLIDSSKGFYPVAYALWAGALALSIGLGLLLRAKLVNALTAAQERKNTTQPKVESTISKNPNVAGVLEVKLAAEDEELLAGESSGRVIGATMEVSENQFPGHVFRAYDIRGNAEEEIDTGFANTLGKALGSQIIAQNQREIFVGRDARTTSPELAQALIEGIHSTGVDTIDLGIIPSPLLHYAVVTSDKCKNGVIVTASHNPANDNGFKFTLDGDVVSDEQIQTLRSDMERGNFSVGTGKGTHQSVTEEYVNEILFDVALMGDVRIVIDAGNGATSELAPKLFSELGCDVVPLFCEFDGTFPNRSPDPSKPENLVKLIDTVQAEDADLGIALDGDGDRLIVVTSSGKIINPDRLLMLFAKDIVSRNPGADVVFDVKCTRQLGSLISGYGGRPIMWKTGHAHMKAKIQETGALLGGEYSGHIFIKERWHGFDDGLLVAARLLEIMCLREQSLDDIFAAFPELPSTGEIRIPVEENKKFDLVNQLIESGDFQTGTASTIDGLRVDFAKGWGLVRASNTAAELTLRFEGDTEEVLDQLKLLFRRELRKLDKDLPLNF
jgi:phosphomannomutase/phosphoglucomutase